MASFSQTLSARFTWCPYLFLHFPLCLIFGSFMTNTRPVRTPFTAASEVHGFSNTQVAEQLLSTLCSLCLICLCPNMYSGPEDVLCKELFWEHQECFVQHVWGGGRTRRKADTCTCEAFWQASFLFIAVCA